MSNVKAISFTELSIMVYIVFYPLFPIGDKRNRHVECKECGSTFIPRVLENNTFNADGSINLDEEKVAAWEFY